MRLFTAICLDDACRDMLCEAMRRLQKQGVRGAFVPRENLHLTLAFIGETQRVAAAEKCLASLRAPRFSVQIEGLGRFARPGGDVLWAGVRAGEALLEVQRKLCSLLYNAGFEMEARPYKPHLTLGRKIFLPSGFSVDGPAASYIESHRQEVAAIALMRSERISERMRYSVLYSQPLG